MLSDQISYVLCIGPWGSGKTSLLHRYVYNLDTIEHKPTPGHSPDFIQTTLRYKDEAKKVTFWDFGGSPSFKMPTIYRNAEVVLIVVDLANLENDLNQLEQYKKDITTETQVDADIILVGTHDDLKNDKEFAACVQKSKLLLKEIARDWQCSYFFVNNFKKSSVDPVFGKVHQFLLERTKKDLPTLKRAADSKRQLQTAKPDLKVVASPINKKIPIMAKRIRPRFKLPSLPKGWKRWAYAMSFAALLLTTLTLLAFSTFGVFPAIVAVVGVASWLVPSLVALTTIILGALVGGLYHWASSKRQEHRAAIERTSTHRNVFQVLLDENTAQGKNPPFNVDKKVVNGNHSSRDAFISSDESSTASSLKGYDSFRSSAATQIGTDVTSQSISPSAKRTFN